MIALISKTGSKTAKERFIPTTIRKSVKLTVEKEKNFANKLGVSF